MKTGSTTWPDGQLQIGKLRHLAEQQEISL
jgi:hypothetical protein